MSSEKPFRKINELVVSLTAAEKGLTAGTLDLDALETASADARELYERLIVLRHKAREAAIGQTSRSVAEAAPEPERPKETAPVILVGHPSVRLDTRPAMEVSPRQTSLIEAIESTEQTEPQAVVRPERRTEERSPAKAPPSVAEKLEKASLADLGKAISVSHKFWFVAELFNGDRATFDRAIDHLNGFSDLAEAQQYMQEEVIAKLKKPADPEALSTFADLVQRRYA